jgi:transcriptional regulator with XRE-family HTH domain
VKKESILSKRLRMARNKNGWTQEQAADKLNISIGTLSGYERGYRSPNPEMIEKLAETYNVTPDYLFGWSKDPKLTQITDPAILKEIEEAQKVATGALERVTKILEKHMIKQDDSPTKN